MVKWRSRRASYRHLHVQLALVFLLLGAADYASAQSGSVVVRPKEIQDLLVNPGMGITTFQRFNGQALNPPLTWSEEGPTEKLVDSEQKPEFPPTSVSYCRWVWDVIEPKHGEFHWEIIDLALREAREHGQTLAIRLMPYTDKHPLPDWYRSSGARRANQPSDKDGDKWQPDYTDPLFLKYWGELVAEAGKRYDGNPFLDSVDISSIGYWGEGWSPYMPAFSYQKDLTNIWFTAFPVTTLLMNFDEEHALTYGTQHGAGWRLDCLGDLRHFSDNPNFQPEMLDVYPQQIVRAGIQEVWQRSPVSLETCGHTRGMEKRHFRRELYSGAGVALACEHRECKKHSYSAGVENAVRRFSEKNGIPPDIAPFRISENGSARPHHGGAHVVVECGSCACLS